MCIRDSLIDSLLEAGAKINAYDPEAMANVAEIYGDRINLATAASEATVKADALVIVTEWDVFRTADLKQLKSDLKKPLIFDGRNLYNHDQMSKLGFEYHSIGRQSA